MNGNEKYYDKFVNRFIFCFILISYIFLVFGCGNNEDVKNSSGGGFGSYAAKLIFPPDIPRHNIEEQSSAKGVQGGIDCEEYGIATINCVLSSADNTIIAEENWQCSEGKGLVSKVPEGKGLTVSVTAINEDGMILLYGEERNVAIIADQRTEGEIVLQRADSPEVKAGDDPRTLTFNWSDIVFPSRVEHYQLQVDPDGNSGDSGFSTIENADNIQGTEFTITIPVHLTDWVNAAYRVVALDAAGNALAVSSEINLIPNVLSEEVIGYFKASNTDANDLFGKAVALSADGNTLAVGANWEDSMATGINGDEVDNHMENSGAVYVFTRIGSTWQQQAYVKASNTSPGDGFGFSVALSDNGRTLAVGASEGSAATGIDGDESDNSMQYSGAVYIFTRSGSTWQQQAYVKASNTNTGDQFGYSIALSSDGNTLAVGANWEDSVATGINGDEVDNNMESSGAVYVFTRIGSTWQQQAYVKASNTDTGIVSGTGEDTGDYFGYSIALSEDGNTLAVGAVFEDSSSRGIDGDEGNNNSPDAPGGNSGAVYVFTRIGSTWQQQAYVKASNTYVSASFGNSVALSDNGDILAVGSFLESSAAKGIGKGDEEFNGTTLGSGAVYFFTRSDGTWQQQAYVKASNTDYSDRFGQAVSFSADGDILAVGAPGEASADRGLNGNDTDNSMSAAGAVYLY